jgi:S-adenosylmethionine/arginine decarboxylase-like enzyme
MRKQTAIEWLQEQLNPDMKTMQGVIVQELLERAKAMEKEQILDAYESAKEDQLNLQWSTQYWNKTYVGEEMSKQTAVEYLIEQLLPKALGGQQHYHIEIAKAMEKEQIVDASNTAIDYYKKTRR